MVDVDAVVGEDEMKPSNSCRPGPRWMSKARHLPSVECAATPWVSPTRSGRGRQSGPGSGEWAPSDRGPPGS